MGQMGQVIMGQVSLSLGASEPGPGPYKGNERLNCNGMLWLSAPLRSMGIKRKIIRNPWTFIYIASINLNHSKLCEDETLRLWMPLVNSPTPHCLLIRKCTFAKHKMTRQKNSRGRIWHSQCYNVPCWLHMLLVTLLIWWSLWPGPRAGIFRWGDLGEGELSSFVPWFDTLDLDRVGSGDRASCSKSWGPNLLPDCACKQEARIQHGRWHSVSRKGTSLGGVVLHVLGIWRSPIIYPQSTFCTYEKSRFLYLRPRPLHNYQDLLPFGLAYIWWHHIRPGFNKTQE